MKRQKLKVEINNCKSKVKSGSGGVVKLYTKSGDGGESGLGGGGRLSKSDLVFEVLGGIDELNSWVGTVVVEAKLLISNDKFQSKLKPQNTNDGDVVSELVRIQETLLKCGVIIGVGKKLRKDIEKEVGWLERRIDWYQGQFGEEWLKGFVLPGGTEVAARADVARAVCRRVERTWVRFTIQDSRFKNHVVGRYLNRLSDYLFAVARWVNLRDTNGTETRC